jgi:hypothetical protein
LGSAPESLDDPAWSEGGIFLALVIGDWCSL